MPTSVNLFDVPDLLFPFVFYTSAKALIPAAGTPPTLRATTADDTDITARNNGKNPAWRQRTLLACHRGT
jgi:hypothetical protein